MQPVASVQVEIMAGRDLDELVRALANGTRRHILRICSDGYVSAGDIAAEIDLALASVSEHLKVLRKTELVELERSGNKWMYRTNSSQLEAVLTELSDNLLIDRKNKGTS